VTVFDGSLLVSGCPQVHYRTNHFDVSRQLHVPVALLQEVVTPVYLAGRLVTVSTELPWDSLSRAFMKLRQMISFFRVCSIRCTHLTAAFNP